MAVPPEMEGGLATSAADGMAAFPTFAVNELAPTTRVCVPVVVAASSPMFAEREAPFNVALAAPPQAYPRYEGNGPVSLWAPAARTSGGTARICPTMGFEAGAVLFPAGDFLV